jgi:micrococcal nuclease
LRRILVYLFAAAVILVAVRLLAPFVVLAAVGLLVVAARWPQALERIVGHPAIQRLPAGFRSTPMRLAGTAAIASIVLAGTAHAVAPPPSVGSAAASAVARATPEPTPRPTAEPTARPTRSPRETPEPTARPTPVATPEPTPVFGREPTGPVQVATVASVTDGDTIRVLLDGQNVPVRYIGIDTPETQNGVEWMGHEATDANTILVAGRQVILEKDVSETDQYGRLLRHVWIETDAGLVLVSLELLRLGVAEVTTYPPDVKYTDELFLPAQREAREAAIGLWGTPPTAVATPAPIAPLVPGSNCEPSYPDVCIPIGSADVDCPDIDARRFRVLWDVANPDPHRFDGDGDGIGCES